MSDFLDGIIKHVREYDAPGRGRFRPSPAGRRSAGAGLSRLQA